MKNKVLTLLVCLVMSLVGKAEGDHGHPHEVEGRHSLSLYTGFTHNAGAYFSKETKEKSTGRWVPTVGLDYFYTMNHKWDIGTIADLELEEYYVNGEHHEREYERTNAVAFIAVGKYKPIEGLGIIFGPGVEFEFKKNIETETLFVAKIGVEYEVHIKNGWAIAPSLIYDYKYSKDLKFSAYSYGFSIGKKF
ncbi:hypothetical protein OAT16_06725 [Prolixibacteraceae bacterium]|nr:hypothetical protein [Prolixibacteraceae bacterium]